MTLGTTRRRLMLAFGGSFAGLLLLGSVALYAVLVRGYREAYDHHLTESAQLALDLFRFDRSEYPTAAAAVAHIMTELVTADRSVAAFDSTGHRIGVARRAPMAPDLSRVSPVGLGPLPSAHRMQGREVRLMLVPLPEGIELVVGVSDAEYHARVHALRVTLGIGIPALLILGALLGARLAEPVLRVQRRFLADVAHELRTPIAIVLAEADAGRAAATPERRQAALAAVASEAERMGAMVSDLMLLAREDDVLVPAEQPLFLDDVAQRAIHRATSLPEATGRSFRLGTWEEAPAQGDAELLERAILALLHNALVHGDRDEITVETGRGEGEAWVRVIDAGPGGRAKPGSGSSSAVCGSIQADPETDWDSPSYASSWNATAAPSRSTTCRREPRSPSTCRRTAPTAESHHDDPRPIGCALPRVPGRRGRALLAGARAGSRRHGDRLSRPRRAARPAGGPQAAPAGAGHDAAMRERFLSEARMAAGLAHPNIVPIHAVEELGPFVFFAMQYVAGETLGDRIVARGDSHRGRQPRCSATWRGHSPMPMPRAWSTATSSPTTSSSMVTAGHWSPTSASPDSRTTRATAGSRELPNT